MRKTQLLLAGLLFYFSASAQWNPNTSVNLEVATVPMADMQAVTTSLGYTWVAFYHQNAGNYDMRAQLISPDGVKLLGPDGILVSNKPSGSATFVFNVCKDASDNLIIGFQDQRSGTLASVVYKISPAGGFLWGLDGIVLGDGLAPYPAVLSNGEVAVAWNESSTNTLNIQKINLLGVKAWANPVVVKVGTTLTTRGQIVPNLNGAFNMIFQKRGTGISTTLYSQRFNNDGTSAWAAPVQICSETTSGARYYSVTSEQDTTYCGYFSSVGFRFNSYLQRVNPDGTIPYGGNGSNFSTATSTNDPYQQSTNIALKPGSPYVWSVCSFSNTNQNQYGVYVQKFNKSNGARNFTDNALNIYPISANFDNQVGELNLIQDAPVFMTEDAANKLYATRLDGNGAFVWTPTRIELSSTTAGGSTPKGRFCFTALADHQAVAAWYESRSGTYRGYAQNITPGGLFNVDITTQGNVPATITTAGGTLQLIATVNPATASQAVTWSILNGTGAASINSAGTVTAIANGTVSAIAVAQADPTVRDTLPITISGQSSAPVNAVLVTTQGGVPATITTAGGTLQLVATVQPANANPNVTWNISPLTGTATISGTGLVTAVSNGTVRARAFSVENPLIYDSITITISNQPIPVTGITVTVQGGAPATITTNGGTLQMVATIAPANATNQNVAWSIVPVTGTATISGTGLVTAQTNGTVYAKAVSVGNPAAKDSVLITITNQVVAVTGITVATQGGVPAQIGIDHGTLQMVATITPANASNQNVTWSIVNGTGTATISAGGLVTAQTNGTVYAKAVSVANPAAKDSLLITLSNQVIQVTGITVTTQGSVPPTITTNGGTLQMIATITPANATYPGAVWNIIPLTGNATINAGGLVTATQNGTVWARAVAAGNSNFVDSMQITISGQVATGLPVDPGSNADLHLSNLMIYPVPANNSLYLKLVQNHPALQLIITDATGHQLYQTSYTANALKNEKTIDVSRLPSGFYIIRFSGKQVDAGFGFVIGKR